MIKNISNLGDASVYCDFGSEVNENINSEVIKYFNYLSQLVKNNKIEGKGILTCPNGERYEGYFKNNKFEGKGI